MDVSDARISLGCMQIVIAGCGRVGSDLAKSLSEDGHDVSVIAADHERLARLGDSFNGRTEVGPPYDVQTLRNVDIEFADAFVAVTPNDNANLMAVQVAKKVFSVPRTIARLDDPARADSYRALDVDYVAGAHLIARVIKEQIVEVEFNYHVTFSSGDVEIVEMRIGSRGGGVSVSDFEVDGRLRVAAVRREGRTYIPQDDFVLAAGDLVVAAAQHGVTGKIGKFLADPSEESL
jgi:trk system potassium uptake protein TrkA